MISHLINQNHSMNSNLWSVSWSWDIMHGKLQLFTATLVTLWFFMINRFYVRGLWFGKLKTILLLNKRMGFKVYLKVISSVCCKTQTMWSAPSFMSYFPVVLLEIVYRMWTRIREWEENGKVIKSFLMQCEEIPDLIAKTHYKGSGEG